MITMDEMNRYPRERTFRRAVSFSKSSILSVIINMRQFIMILFREIHGMREAFQPGMSMVMVLTNSWYPQIIILDYINTVPITDGDAFG
jgi:hypothetical protein